MKAGHRRQEADGSRRQTAGATLALSRLPSRAARLLPSAACLLLASATAQAYEVVLIRPTQYLADHPDRLSDASTFLGRARALLDEAGFEHHTLNEADVLQGGLSAGEFLLCAYNPDMPAEVAAAVAGFLDGGGRALFCYYLSDPLRDKLGLAPLQYAAAGDARTMEYLAAGPAPLAGQPRRVRQGSWNANLTQPTRPEVTMPARWLSADGKSSPGAALFIGPQAAFLGHVLTAGDTARKAELLAAIISHYRPGTWDLLASRVLDRAFVFRHAPDAAAFDALCRTPRARDRLAKLRDESRDIDRARQHGHGPEAFRRSRDLRVEAERLYLACLPRRKNEFRGAWVVMPGGVGDWGWEKTARAARRNRLRALFVRVEWRGEAHYKSSVLPIAEEVRSGADPLRDAVAACHKHGVQVHAWFINHNWRTPPQELIDEFSAQGRWQVSPEGEDRVLEGGSRVYWLNPSDPRNVELQAKMMAEVARDYDVDGVHFDYIRYENYSGSYGAADRERFERDTGLTLASWPADVLPRRGDTPAGRLHEQFLEWRVTQVSNVVKACSEAVRAARPSCKLSAAVYPAWPAHRLQVGQDWPRWLAEGWIDFVCPMNYDPPGYYERHEQRVIAQRAAAGDHPLYSGIGSYLQPDAIAVADQIVSDRRNGADGVLLFSYTADLATDILPKLRRGPLR